MKLFKHTAPQFAMSVADEAFAQAAGRIRSAVYDQVYVPVVDQVRAQPYRFVRAQIHEETQ